MISYALAGIGGLIIAVVFMLIGMKIGQSHYNDDPREWEELSQWDEHDPYGKMEKDNDNL